MVSAKDHQEEPSEKLVVETMSKRNRIDEICDETVLYRYRFHHVFFTGKQPIKTKQIMILSSLVISSTYGIKHMDILMRRKPEHLCSNSTTPFIHEINI